jgi:hypothetical protein
MCWVPSELSLGQGKCGFLSFQDRTVPSVSQLPASKHYLVDISPTKRINVRPVFTILKLDSPHYL